MPISPPTSQIEQWSGSEMKSIEKPQKLMSWEIGLGAWNRHPPSIVLHKLKNTFIASNTFPCTKSLAIGAKNRDGGGKQRLVVSPEAMFGFSYHHDDVLATANKRTNIFHIDVRKSRGFSISWQMAHKCSVYKNSCIRPPVNPTSRRPTPHYERSSSAEMAREGHKEEVSGRGGSEKIALCEEIIKENSAFQSLMDFYSNIPGEADSFLSKNSRRSSRIFCA